MPLPLPSAGGERYVDAMRAALALVEPPPQPDGRQVDVPVGAVVLDSAGTVIGSGTNARERDSDPTGHAEMVAMRAAASSLDSWRLDGCTLVVTLEPCTMCAGAVVLARVGTLVFGAYDAKAGAVGSLWDVVRDRRLNHRPHVIGGVLAEETGEVLRRFFAERRGNPLTR
jgi:tRNA(adenine34) deaminase